jgi:uncharacterized protein YjbI with pentapeptide repeats/lipopolysaccharide biosynthesis regulator YciM
MGPPEKDLRFARLRGARLVGRKLRGADLRNADLSHADLRGADLSGASLVGARLDYASLEGADLSGADLTRASLRNADFRGAVLAGADLRGADLAGARIERCDLRKALFAGNDLAFVRFRDADLSGAGLRGADLAGASFLRCSLKDADLCGAALRDAELDGCSAQGADFSAADLRDAYFHGTDLRAADVRGARFWGARGLDRVQKSRLAGRGADTDSPALLRLRKAVRFVAARRWVQAALAALAVLIGLRTAAFVKDPAMRSTPALTAKASKLERKGDLLGANRLHLIIARRYEKSGNWKDLHPWFAAARNYRSLGRPAEAREIYERLLRQPLPRRETRAQLNTELAQFHVEAGRLDEAADLLRDVVRGAPPSSPHAWNAGFALAAVQARQGRLEEAARGYERLLADARQNRPENVDTVRVPLAGVYAKTGRTAEALSHWRDVAGNTAADPWLRRSALSELGTALERQGRAEEAVGVYRELLEGHRDAETAGMAEAALAGLYARMGKTDEAFRHFEAAAEKYPRGSQHRFMSQMELTRLHQKTGDLQRAAALLASVKREFADSPAKASEAGEVLAGLYKSSGRLAEAAEEYESLLGGPARLRAQLNLLEIRRGKADVQATAERYRELTREHANSPDDLAAVRNAFAAFHAQSGNPAAAAELWESVLSQPPGDVWRLLEARIGLMNLHWLGGRKDAARAAYEDLLREHRDSPELTAHVRRSFTGAER